jgi:hypothetical protein
MVASVLLAGRVAPERVSIADEPERPADDEPVVHLADADPDPYGAIAARHADHVTADRRRTRPTRTRRRLVRVP